MQLRLLPALFLVFTLFGFAAPADAKRVALVVGIGDYDTLSGLPNPVPDARAIAGVLRRHGFEVQEHYDLGRADLL
ncbi:MAG: caspase family protein, partial [bacterium]|nr:caspase family protein [bacterium]